MPVLLGIGLLVLVLFDWFQKRLAEAPVFERRIRLRTDIAPIDPTMPEMTVLVQNVGEAPVANLRLAVEGLARRFRMATYGGLPGSIGEAALTLELVEDHPVTESEFDLVLDYEDFSGRPMRLIQPMRLVSGRWSAGRPRALRLEAKPPSSW